MKSSRKSCITYVIVLYNVYCYVCRSYMYNIHIRCAMNAHKYQRCILYYAIVRFILNSMTRTNEFRGSLSQFGTNFHDILHNYTNLVMGRIWHVVKFWDTGFIESDIVFFISHMLGRITIKLLALFDEICRLVAAYLENDAWHDNMTIFCLGIDWEISGNYSPRLMSIRLYVNYRTLNNTSSNQNDTMDNCTLYYIIF